MNRQTTTQKINENIKIDIARYNDALDYINKLIDGLNVGPLGYDISLQTKIEILQDFIIEQEKTNGFKIKNNIYINDYTIGHFWLTTKQTDYFFQREKHRLLKETL